MQLKKLYILDVKISGFGGGVFRVVLYTFKSYLISVFPYVLNGLKMVLYDVKVFFTLQTSNKINSIKDNMKTGFICSALDFNFNKINEIFLRENREILIFFAMTCKYE